MTVYGLYRGNPNEIGMIAPSKAAAATMRAMFGPAWKARKLTAAEANDPWVLAEIATLTAEGVWNA
jgi:hypothetical protein